MVEVANSHICLLKTRAVFYLVMVATDDEETQKKGVCVVVNSVAGEFVEGKTDLRTVISGPWCVRALPQRVCAIHQCFEDPSHRAIVNFSMRFLPPSVRAKVKVHFGTFGSVEHWFAT